MITRKSLARFRLRTLMIAVAVVGAVLGVWLEASRMIRQARIRRSLATGYAAKERDFVRILTWDARRVSETTDRLEKETEKRFKLHYGRLLDDCLLDEAWHRRMADWYGQLRRNYDRGAARPWESVPNDPPEPSSFIADLRKGMASGLAP